MKIQLTIAGFGGQGIMLLVQMLAYAASKKNQNSLWFPSYGPETRGGTANCAVTISDDEIHSPVFSKADAIIVFNQPSLDKFQSKVKDEGQVFFNASTIDASSINTKAKKYAIDANRIANELGNIKVANMVMLGAFLAINPIFSDEEIIAMLKKVLGEKKKDLVDINISAISLGKKAVKAE